MPTTTELKTPIEVPNDASPEIKGKDKKLSGTESVSKAAQKLKTTTGQIPKSCRTTTMDAAKALGILGFTSTRWLDMSSGLTPKEELDKAHFSKTMDIMKKKKKKDEKEAKTKTKEKEKDSDVKPKPKPKVVVEANLQKYSFKRKELSPDDQIRVLHEAYQFLLKKHKIGDDLHGLLAESDQSKINASEETEKVEEEEEGARNDSDDDSSIFNEEVLALERAVESALDSISPQPSASEQEMARNFKRKSKSVTF